MADYYQTSGLSQINLSDPVARTATKGTFITLIECQTDCIIKIHSSRIILNQFDMIVIRGVNEVALETVTGKKEARILVINQNVLYPLPLVYLISSNNRLFHDLIQSQEKRELHIVFNDLKGSICDDYCQIIEKLDQEKVGSSSKQFQRETVVGLILTELIRQHYQ